MADGFRENTPDFSELISSGNLTADLRRDRMSVTLCYRLSTEIFCSFQNPAGSRPSIRNLWVARGKEIETRKQKAEIGKAREKQIPPLRSGLQGESDGKRKLEIGNSKVGVEVRQGRSAGRTRPWRR